MGKSWRRAEFEIQNESKNETEIRERQTLDPVPGKAVPFFEPKGEALAVVVVDAASEAKDSPPPVD